MKQRTVSTLVRKYCLFFNIITDDSSKLDKKIVCGHLKPDNSWSKSFLVYYLFFFVPTVQNMTMICILCAIYVESCLVLK